MSLSKVALPKHPELSCNVSIKGFHEKIRETYGMGKTIDIQKAHGKSWIYSCRGECGFTCTGYMNRKAGKLVFGVKGVINPEHTGCTDCGAIYEAPTPLQLPSAKSSTPSSSNSESEHKKNRVNWNLAENQEKLKKAVDRVAIEGEGQRKVAAETAIPQALLSKIISGKRSMETTVGRATMLPADIEATLARYCLQLAETGWGVGRPELKLMANQLAKLFPEKVSTFKASNSWAQGFMMRNPNCVARRGQSFEVRRASGLNPKACNNFFKILQKAFNFVKENSPENPDGFDGDFFINIDESSMAIKNAGRKIIARLGSRRVHVLGFDKLCSSRMTSVNAVGAGRRVFDPFYILQGTDEKFVDRTQKNSDGSLKCFDKECKWTVADKGYMTTDIWENRVVPDIVAQVCIIILYNNTININ
jgi:hypothetical protein